MLNQRLLVAIIATQHLVHRLSAATGQSREQILQELSISLDQTIAAAEAKTDNDDQ